MEHPDPRRLSPAAQEALRRRVVRAVSRGMTQTRAARRFGVARPTVVRWMRAYRQGGVAALRARRRGCPRGFRLPPHLARWAVGVLTRWLPEQAGVRAHLWTRGAVRALLARGWGRPVSQTTVARYLAAWGIVMPDLLDWIRRRTPMRATYFRLSDLPGLRRAARAAHAAFVFVGVDELTPSPPGAAGPPAGADLPVGPIPLPGRQAVLFAVGPRGEIAFLFTATPTGGGAQEFLRRLRLQTYGPLWLLAPPGPLFEAPAVQRWVREHAASVRLTFLADAFAVSVRGRRRSGLP